MTLRQGETKGWKAGRGEVSQTTGQAENVEQDHERALQQSHARWLLSQVRIFFRFPATLSPCCKEKSEASHRRQQLGPWSILSLTGGNLKCACFVLCNRVSCGLG